MKKLVVIFLAFCLVGCAGQRQRAQANQAKFDAEVPVCVGESDCRAKWEAAQVWIVRNSGFKLQVATDVLLETYNSTNSSVKLAVRVVKVPMGGGKYRIEVTTRCANIFGCSPDSWAAAHDFNQVVGAAQP